MEPAVKPAALGTRTGVIGVLATAGTLKGSKYLTSKGNVEDNVKVVEHVGSGFVELVESGRLEGPEVEKTVSESLQPLLRAGADIIVLGCTHYPFLLPVMEKIAGPSVRFIDPAPAVARHLADVMKEDGLLSGKPSADISLSGRPDVSLFSSGDDACLRSLFELAICREEGPSDRVRDLLDHRDRP